jgi:dihydroneopterin aldolase
MSIVLLRGITFEGRHGVTTDERLGTRKFEVDVEIDDDLSAGESSDRLSDTIDYRIIAGVIVDIGTGESHHLVESLARDMIDRLVREFPHAQISLELRKLAPPGCPGHPAAAGVRLRHPAAR